MKNDVVVLITARGGSKGLPRKNILPLWGKPLIAWTIEAAMKAQSVDRVFVSSDDEQILEISKDYGAETICRPAELASDTASSDSVISHTLDHLVLSGVNVSTLVLLQPTSPLRTFAHVDDAVYKLQSQNADCVISVFEPSHTPIKAYVENEDGSIKGLFSLDAPYTRRQDLPRAFQPNGAIYAFKVNKFQDNGHIPRTNVYPYVMSEIESADIDTQDDLDKLNNYLKGEQNV